MSGAAANQVVHVAAAIMRRGDEIVLVRQGARGEEPFWALPGGVVDEGELVPEALVREVREETGLEIAVQTRLAFVRQIDDRRPRQPVAAWGPGCLATVWVFEVDSWSGELDACDPDGVVSEACLVPVDEAVVRLRHTHWLELPADYLDGRVEPGSLRFERWHEDGRVEIVREPPSDNLYLGRMSTVQQPLTSPLVDFFLELCAIPSPSGQERAVADRVGGYLTELGLEWDEDDTAIELDGTTGSIYCRLPASNGAGGTPIFLCAHTDTVPPEAGIDPVVGEDGIVRNAAGAILGSDNKAAVVVMLEAARRIVEESRLHAGIELLFTPQEEVSLRGADAFDHTRLVAHTGFVYDQGAPIGEIVLGSPHGRLLDFRFHGRSAHAGMFPEEGRSAVAAASRAIADFRLGRIDEETSANVGVITGGTARNVVPEWCFFTAEVRSHDERKAVDLVREMLETAAFAASLGECEVESEVRPSFPGYRFRENDSPVVLAATALRAAGFEPTYALSGGGADANVFNARGLSCVNLANGMMEIHTPDEHIAVQDLDAMVEVTLALVDAARET